MRLRLSLMTTALVLLGTFAWAESEGLLNRLLAPGPLIEGHKDLEHADCLSCHEAGKGINTDKCLECHKEIRADVKAARGFHGLTKETCITCHSDHKGRTFNAVTFNEEKFDHKTTGFVLDGKHAELSCAKCHIDKRTSKPAHKTGTRFFGKTNTCLSCHRKDDVHFFVGEFAKKDCGACHSPSTWKKEIKFDHNKDTKYKLLGKHAEMKCAECHVPKKGSKTGIYHWAGLEKQQCLSCHKDFHQNNLSAKFKGGKCDTCHNQREWKLPEFKHDSVGFKLGGKHAEAKCFDCHKQAPKTNLAKKADLKWAGLKTQCLACHKDYHKFPEFKLTKMGNASAANCSACHTDRNWKDTPNFDHSKQTRYVIDGKHKELACKDCHLPKKNNVEPARGIYHWNNLAKDTCGACHKNPHIGVFKPELLKKACTECHTTDSWSTFKGDKSFDHSKTRFPLTGAHVKSSCGACHVKEKKQVFKFASLDKQFCNDCHQTPHKGQFSAKFAEGACVQCHGTKTWSELLKFDHNKTNYSLKGEHQQLKCSECHTPTNDFFNTKPAKAKSKFLFPEMAKKDCTACHADFHKGQLGSNCSSCHNETSWKKVSFDHQRQSRFALKGEHMSLKCSECHKPASREAFTFGKKSFYHIQYKPLATACVDCHKDPHKGSFGKSCQECHAESGWKSTRDFHKNFTLTGIHYTLECSECHKDSRKLAGMSSQCIGCHAKEDVHKGTLPRCQECHTQQFWEYGAFKHSLTRFALRGVHRTLDCIDCHSRGIYKGTPSACSSCHINDAMAATSFSHAPIGNYMDCTRCHHNHFTFQSAQ